MLVCLGSVAPSIEAGPSSGVTAAVQGERSIDLFSDVTEQVGLDFVHFNGGFGELQLPEITGQGGALLDFDNDGDLDAYFVQGSMIGHGKTLEDAVFAPHGPVPPRDQLFRNDLIIHPDGTREVHLVDVTEASGIRAFGYGMGVAAADYDNDGWTDLYLTTFGDNQMYRNNGDGTFTDVTAISGSNDPLWSTSASFFDYDFDGWLDLYVADYVDFDVVDPPRCYSMSSRRDYCGPGAFEPQPDRLFRNRGDGTFDNVTAAALIGYEPGPGLGVATADFNGDGWMDIYVANDGQPNQLWINQKDGTFFDDALLAGAAVNRGGIPEASMGVDAGDYDADGDEDLFMTHIMGETNTLLVNDGTGMFEDRTIESQLAGDSIPFTSFGTGWFDYDNDGWLDLLMLNGEVRIIEALALAGDPYPLHQQNQLFRNLQGRGFEDVTELAGEAFHESHVSRGAAFGDVDNDGDTDVLVVNNNGPAHLLINNTGNRRPWLGLHLVGRKQNRDMIGTRIEVLRREGDHVLWRRIKTDGSYCSASDPRVLVGLGEASEVSTLRIYPPGGEVIEWTAPPLGRYLMTLPEDPS
jgi:hypothetical protein